MDAAIEKMETQLKEWRVKIDNLAARTPAPGVRAGFDDLIYVDELKALHAIAQSQLDEFKKAGDKQQGRLKAEMKSAWNELAAAFKNPKPSR